jgi:phytoene dehydrogenase-like protein
VVISAIDIKRTFLELIAPEHLSRWRLRRVRRYQMSPAVFTVYLGLDADLRERMPNTNWWWVPGYDLDRIYATVRRDHLPAEPYLYAVSGSVKDPDTAAIAPPGCSSVEIMGLVPHEYRYWNVGRGPAAGGRYSRDREYLQAKERIADAMIRTVARRIPPLADIEKRILWKEASTPITQERYTLSTDGAFYGLEMTTDQTGLRRPLPKTRVPGLYLAGASTFFCHGLLGTMLGGIAAAGAVLRRDLLQEVHDGAVFADRSQITAGGPDWDPFYACRRLSVKKPPRACEERERATPAEVA